MRWEEGKANNGREGRERNRREKGKEMEDNYGTDRKGKIRGIIMTNFKKKSKRGEKQMP